MATVWFVLLGKNENSIYRRITCGVPQSSPFLDHVCFFLIHINDLFRNSSKLTPIMFANDANLFISDSNIENLFETRKIASCLFYKVFLTSFYKKKKRCTKYLTSIAHRQHFNQKRSPCQLSRSILRWKYIRVLEWFIKLAIY